MLLTNYSAQRRIIVCTFFIHQFIHPFTWSVQPSIHSSIVLLYTGTTYVHALKVIRGDTHLKDAERVCLAQTTIVTLKTERDS